MKLGNDGVGNFSRRAICFSLQIRYRGIQRLAQGQ
jgi:hypothetical protein